MNRRFFNPGINLLCGEYWLVKRWEVPSLAAPFWRVYHNDDPTAEIVFHGKTYHLSPDCIYLIAPETAAQAHCDGPFRHMFIHFTAQFPYDCPTPGIYSFPFIAPEREIIESIKAYLRSGGELATGQTLQLLALCSLALTRVPQESLETPIEDKRILKTVKYIQTSFSKKISNHELAGVAMMNVNAFIRLFRQNIGLAPQQFLTEFRLRKACLLLLYSDDTIDEIAEKTGFCNRFYFTKMFTRGRKMSPVRFRSQVNAGFGSNLGGNQKVVIGGVIHMERIID